MMRKVCLVVLVITSIAIFTTLRIGAAAKAWGAPGQSRSLITERIEESRRVTLRGNTRPEAIVGNDRGSVWGGFKLEHMLLLLKRPPEQEQALNAYIESLTDKTSPNFRKWLTADQLGSQYGVSDKDISAITNWLESYGITVNYVYPNKVLLDISGSAAELRRALRVEIHFLDVNGERHFANVNDPEIPAALAPAVVGIVSMHDFKPHAMYRPRTKYTVTDSNGTFYLVTPQDVATIYNLNPLFSQGLSGQGQTIVVVEDTNLFTNNDWTTFRSEFGLSGYTSGNLTTVHPAPTSSCANPGTNGDDGEAIIDAEYASAAAPSASIEVASCTDTATFGGLLALENLVNAGNPPAIVSMSYGFCEAGNGAAANAAFNTTYQQAAGLGVSVFVSSGDESAASCDANAASATHGIGVTGWGSTPFNVSVGGTDFSDTFNNQNSAYWSTSNASNLGSALGYIPEIPWNDSCAGFLLSSFAGFATPYGSTGFCASASGANFRTTASGSGGPSGCATGTSSTARVVSGSCAGYAKPSWQSVFGNPNDGVRDIPDVSLFAANGVWSHFYVYCYTDTANGGVSCAGAPDPVTNSWSGAGGTSFSSPIMAGIQSLVNQRVGTQVGNPNPTYYTIAAAEYGATGNATCNSSTQPVARRGVSSTCVFYDVTQGDISVNCTGANNCWIPSSTRGVLNTGKIAVALGAQGAGFTSTPTCTVSSPGNSGPYQAFAGSVQATCTATRTTTHVSAVTISNAGAGYFAPPTCTISGGGGTGATCTATVSVAVATGYEPAFPATAGWDFATGLGTVNAYNLVFDSHW